MFWTEESIAFLRDAAAINRYYETIAERIAPQLPENAHICDAGCGIGELSLALKPYCHHVTAVDADELAIKTLKAHLIEGVTARCGDSKYTCARPSGSACTVCPAAAVSCIKTTHTRFPVASCCIFCRMAAAFGCAEVASSAQTFQSIQ